MLPGLLIGLREGLEAALIVGLTLSILTQTNQQNYRGTIWSGVISAAGISLITGFMLQWFGASLQGTAEEIFEGTMMLLASGVLTWMIFWMQRQSRQYQNGLKAEVTKALQGGRRWALFGIAFFAVLREGVETSLFLTATALVADERLVFLGALIGIASAIFLGWLLFKTTLRLELRRFFQVTGFLLILFAAGLFAHGVHEFVEAGWFPAIIDPIWNINHILDENSILGSILKALFGYNGDPTLTESLAYLAYVVFILLGFRRVKLLGARTSGTI
jgi:high-affinity iron transporter